MQGKRIGTRKGSSGNILVAVCLSMIFFRGKESSTLSPKILAQFITDLKDER